MLTENWSELTADEKYEVRMKKWVEQDGVEFSPEAKKAYNERCKNIRDAVELKKPAKTPVCPMVGFLPAYYAGITCEDAMYDYDKLAVAMDKYHKDFMPDSLYTAFLFGPGEAFEKLDFKLYKWPGHGTNVNTPYQCWEDEYMKADEYDEFITDPSNFFMRKYLPRIFGALAPWQALGPFTDIVELPFVGSALIPVGIPDVQEAYKKYLEAGQMAMKWIGAIGAMDAANKTKYGIPLLLGGICKVPFDTLGDTLRGTEPLMLDLFRRPEKVHKAMEVLTAINIELGIRTATTNNCPFVFMPLHKGADGFLSNKQYGEFYWPYFKAVMLGLINEGLIPLLFAEGGYNQRLEFINDPDIPAGKMLWYFDATDMAKAKEILGEKTCIAGNVPASLFQAGKPEEVEEYVKNLLDTVGKDGGYIVSNGAVLDDGNMDSIKAMFEATRKYG
ncbi:MAG TPA: uroporphyrinogen decarboxylase [Firmicutes bacterium]|nr:uroporphyrinogen decarboxylase [Bacillota bacterium]